MLEILKLNLWHKSLENYVCILSLIIRFLWCRKKPIKIKISLLIWTITFWLSL